MEETEVIATFGPAAGDWATLSKSSRKTLEALFRHPLAHNLEWSALAALFEALGTVEQKPHHEMSFKIGGEHHRTHKPHGKELTTAEVMEFRHMLTRAGWSPQAPVAAGGAQGAGEAPDAAPDLLAVVDHHEARLYRLDLRPADMVDHVISPYDLHHFRHPLSHKDQPRDRGQRTPEDHSFYERIAEALAGGRRIVLIGHGKGHSNAAHHLNDYVKQHHPETFQRIVCEVVADLSSLTAPQLLDVGRRALTPG